MKAKNARKKLEKRIAAYEAGPGKQMLIGQGLLQHKPGSQNRRK